MAEGLFENQDVGGISGGVQPQQAVAPAPSVLTTAVSSGLTQALGHLSVGLIEGYKEGKKEDALNTQSAIFSGYAKKVTALNAAVAQGGKTQAAAQREQRALYNQYIANFPQLTDKLTEFNSKLMGSEGLGDTLAKGSAVDQQIQADTKQATAAGFINPGMTPEQQESGLNAFRAQQHQLNQMDFYSKQLGITQQKLAIQSSQESIAASRVSRANAALELQARKEQARVRQSLADLASSEFSNVKSKLGGLYNDISTGKLTKEQGLAKIQLMKEDLVAKTINMRGGAGADYVDSMIKPLNDIITAQEDFISGKITKDVYQSQLDTNTVKTQLDILQDPMAAKTVALSKMFGANFNLNVLAKTGKGIVDLIDRTLSNLPAGNMTPDSPADREQTKAFFSTLKEATKNLGNKDPRILDHKGTFKEVEAHANQVLQGVADFSSAQKNPAQLNDVIDYLASPEFFALHKMGATFDSEAVEGAKNAVNTNYNDKLIPAVRDAWREALTSIGAPQGVRQIGRVTIPVQNQKNTTDVIRYVWTGNSIQFSAAPGYEKNPAVLSKARELQKTLSPLINKSVRAAAHLHGSQDYTQYFKQNEEVFFGNPAEAPDAQ